MHSTCRAMRLTLLGLAVAIAGTGCGTVSPASRGTRVSRYLASRPDRAEAVGEALNAGRPVPGMTANEVQLCMGRPKRIEKTGPERRERRWHYTRPSGASYRTIDHSPLWILDIPVARIEFDAAGIVTNAIFFGAAPGAGRAAAPHASADPEESVVRALPDEPPASPAPAPRPAAPSAAAIGMGEPVPARPTAAGDPGFEGWPAITLSGVLTGSGGEAALLNGRLIRRGDTIEGVRVLSVDGRGAVLDRAGEVRLLKVGASTQKPKVVVPEPVPVAEEEPEHEEDAPDVLLPEEAEGLGAEENEPAGEP